MKIIEKQCKYTECILKYIQILIYLRYRSRVKMEYCNFTNSNTLDIIKI